AADVRRSKGRGKLAALLGLEGGDAVGTDVARLRALRERRVRYVTLTHMRTNAWGDSSGDASDVRVRHHDGLSDTGRRMVREMNRLGILVDVSHVADAT